MPITVIRRPIVSSGGNDFRFNSIGIPTIYELERRDFAWSQVNDNGGFTQVQYTGQNLTSSFAVGDTVYLHSLSNSLYDVYTTVSAVLFSAGNTLVTTAFAYAGASATGFVNNDTERQGYYIEVRFFDTDDELLTDAILELSPDSVGRMIVDISEFAKAFLSPDFGSHALALFNIVDDELASKEIYIGYREVWIGSQELETADDSNPITVVLGAQQLPLSNGSNYGITTDRYTSLIDGTLKANFLRRSSVIKAWRGWPFSISFLLQFDSEIDVSLLITGNIASPTSSGATPSDTNLLKTANIGNAWGSFPTDTQLILEVINDGDSTELTKEVTVTVEEPCANPIMLLFRNSLGGDCWQMFDFSQEYSYIDDNGTKVKRMLLNTQFLTADQWDELNDMITYGAELKENIVEVLSTTNKTKSRAYQQVYKVDQDGTLTGVVVIPTLNTTNTRKRKHTFEVEIEFPEYFLP